MPTRMIRDGLLSSDAVNSLSPQAEVLFVRLILIADDFGRHDARPSILRAKLFPLKLDAVTDSNVSAWLTECESAGLVRRYSVAGKPFLEIPKFGQRMRAKVSKCPSPPDGSTTDDGHMTVTCPTHDRQMPVTRRHESESESEAEAEAEEYCPEPDEPATGPTPEPPVMTFACAGSGPKEWGLTKAKLGEWVGSYPGVDVLAELRKARQWTIDNPTRRKTARGMTAFLSRWLAKAQDQPRGRGIEAIPPPTATPSPRGTVYESVPPSMSRSNHHA